MRQSMSNEALSRAGRGKLHAVERSAMLSIDGDGRLDLGGAYVLRENEDAPMINALVSRALRDRAALSNRLKQEVIDPLSVVLLGLDRAIHLFEAGESAQAGIPESKTQLKELKRLFRALTAFDFDLYPNRLKELGLEAAVRGLVRAFAERTPGITVDCDIAVLADPTFEKRDLAVFSVCKEALENVGFHAQARSMRMALNSIEKQGLRLQISDDGLGMPESFHRHGAVGIGLSTMRAMVSETGGTFEVFSKEHSGTVLSIVWRPDLKAGPS
jgi:signal transduction histidine kinase